jgi:hypothetical protein
MATATITAYNPIGVHAVMAISLQDTVTTMADI